MLYQDTIWGDIEINDPLVIELISTPTFERLKGIHNCGIHHYVCPGIYRTTRYEHTIGVYLILKHLGASYDEQIAGLLHDASHTAFSHLIDYVLGDASKQDYQDSIHEEFILHSEISKILNKHGVNPAIVSKHSEFSLLDQEMPNVCADRIDYFLRDIFYYGSISKKEIKDFLKTIIAMDGKIIINNLDQALWLGKKFMWANENSWADPRIAVEQQIAGQAIKIAFDKSWLKKEDFFSTDAEFMALLKKVADKKIQEKLDLLNLNTKFIFDENDYDYLCRYKVRYLNPWVLVNGEIKVLSEVNPEFKKEINKFLERSKGYYKIRIVK
jgi:HD superfamily phosphohydrolase